MKRFSLFVLMSLVFALALSVSAQESYTVKTRTARVRAEPNTTASVVATLRANTVLDVIAAVDGESVSGSTVWYHINLRSGAGYIHSSLVQAPSGGGLTTSGGGGSRSSDPVSTPVPNAPAPSGVSCNGARTCSQMASCEQAYACLPSRPGLDRDKDGVPCESICPGG